MKYSDLKIKVCGMREDRNIQDLIKKTNPDFIGLIFHQNSKRAVKKKLKKSTLDLFYPNSKINLVGVFVEQSVEEIDTIAKHYQLNLLQLHAGDSHDFDFCQKLKAKGHKIIKVFRVNQQSRLNQEMNYFVKQDDWANSIDYLLFDTQTEKFGGQGVAFDWSVIPESIPLPFFLSGGLSYENLDCIQEWISKRIKFNYSLPFALDLNSKFEISPALKEVEKIRQFKSKLNKNN